MKFEKEECKMSNSSDQHLLVELLFSLPVSNAKIEQMLSLMKQIKTNGRSSLSEKFLSALIRICMEGPEPEFFLSYSCNDPLK